jgi:hypothetical protein
MEQHALEYASRDWRVVPLHTPAVGGCSCGKADCGSVGKHPRTAHGLNDASADPTRIRRWWTKWPTANIGLLTGTSGIVIDIDARHGGDKSLAALEAEHGPLPATAKSQTGGGWHLMFAHPGGSIANRSNVRPGIDVRGDGGYIVAPPSLHASGNHYRWIIPPDELAPIPEWLLALINPPKPPPKPATNLPSGNFDDALAAMRKIKITDGKDGSRRLYTYACRAVAHNLTDEETIRAIRIMELERPFPK